MVTQVDSLKLDSRLKVDTFLVQELKLSTLLLMNDARYPWLILVPRVLSSSGILFQKSLTWQKISFWSYIEKLSSVHSS